jgi:putative phosphoesterase
MKRSVKKLFNLRADKKLVKDTKPIKDGSLEIIIVSDNHLEKSGLAKVLEYHADADHFLHCGDSNLQPDLDLMKSFVTVSGNTDFFTGYQNDEIVELATGENIWITHGHNWSVGIDTDKLIRQAERMVPTPAIVLYGHTHRVDVSMQKGILIINPGSIAFPRDGIRRTYAKLQVTPEIYNIQILNIKNHSLIKELKFSKN